MKQTIVLNVYDYNIKILEVYEVDNELIVISNCGERIDCEEFITSQNS